jgi:diguanylate cyclase (GGDEF)-like protein
MEMCARGVGAAPAWRSLGLIVALTVSPIALAAAPPAATATADATEQALKHCFHLQRSRPAEAVKVANGILAKHPPVKTEIKALSCLGIANTLTRDMPRALSAASRMVALLKGQQASSRFTLRVFSSAGTIYQTAGKIYLALGMYQKALRVARGPDTRQAALVLLENIGLIYSNNLGDYKKAENYFQRSDTILRKHPISSHEMLLNANHALNYIRMGRDADALKALARSEVAAKHEDNRLFQLRIKSERIGIDVRAGKLASAAPALQSVIAAQHKLPDAIGESRSLVFLSQLQLKQKDAEAALKSARRAEQRVTQDRYKVERRTAMKAQIAALRQLGRFREALDVAQQLHSTQVGTLRKYATQGLAQLQARMQNARNKRVVQQLRHERRIQALKLSDSRRLRNWIIAGAALLIGFAVAFALLQWRYMRRLRQLSRLDGLTGLMNRRTATARLDGKLVRADADGARDMIILIDIDRFKSINDRYGHAAGDDALIALAQRFKAFCRPQDTVARWGGEEFMVVCPHTTLEQAERIAERLRAAVADTPFEIIGGPPLRLTISVGFAPYPFFPKARGKSWQDTLQLADHALYASKRSGRNTWAGLWGRFGKNLETGNVLKDLEAATANGAVTALSRHPDAWSHTNRGVKSREMVAQEIVSPGIG